MDNNGSARRQSPTLFMEGSHLPRVVVIGGGFAGIELVKHLDTRRYQVLMLDRHNYHTFQPLLYQVATAGLEPDSIAQPLRKVFAKKKNFHFRMANVERVDSAARLLHTDIGAIPYDVLVVATGTKTNYFGNDKMRQGTFPMKQVPHALDLRSHILQSFEAALLQTDEAERRALLTFVIVGAGPTGVELAGALAELRKHVLPCDYPELDFSQMEIYVVEGTPKVLGAMSEKSSARAKRYLEGFGVQLRLGTVVAELDGPRVLLKDGSTLMSHNVIWTAGVTGNLPAGFEAASINKANRLLVDAHGQIVGLPNVFALGDIAAIADEQNPNGHPQLAPVAIQQGRHLARNLNGLAEGRPLKPFTYFNKGVMATIGRNKAVIDLPNGWSLGGFIAWLGWMFIHLLYLVGFRNKAVVVTNWLYNYLTYDRGTRLIVRPFIKNKQQPAPAAQAPADSAVVAATRQAEQAPAQAQA